MGCSALMAAYLFKKLTLLQIKQFVKFYFVLHYSDSFIDYYVNQYKTVLTKPRQLVNLLWWVQGITWIDILMDFPSSIITCYIGCCCCLYHPHTTKTTNTYDTTTRTNQYGRTPYNNYCWTNNEGSLHQNWWVQSNW